MREDEERGTEGKKTAISGKTVANSCHRMLTNTKVDVVSFRVRLCSLFQNRECTFVKSVPWFNLVLFEGVRSADPPIIYSLSDD